MAPDEELAHVTRLAHRYLGRPNAAWLGCAVMAFNLTRAAATLTKNPALAKAATATIRRKFINVPARIATSARRLSLHLRPLGQYARRFVVRADVEPATWTVRLGRDSAVLTIPMGGGRVYCYVDGPSDDPRSRRELVARYAAPVPSLLDALDAAGGESAVPAGAVEEVVLTSWSHDGAVLLIGDAPHATSPNMAQGAAMALEDALVLPVSRESATTATKALADFERRRRPRTDWIREQTHRRDRARKLPPAVRNVVLSRFGPRILLSNYRPLITAPDH